MTLLKVVSMECMYGIVELICCTLKTNIGLYVNYTSVEKIREKNEVRAVKLQGEK